MKKYLVNIALLLSTTLILSSCHTPIRDKAAFYAWMNDQNNGLITTKTIQDVVLTVKYLPAEYLAFKDLKSIVNPSQKIIDSLVEQYRDSRAFLLTIQPNPDYQANGDILYKGVGSYVEYRQRIMDLNFSIEKFISIKADDQTFKPLLSSLENNYGISEKQSVYLLFADNTNQKGLLNAPQLDLVFEDALFGSGINHFKFQKKDLDNIPSIDYLKLL